MSRVLSFAAGPCRGALRVTRRREFLVYAQAEFVEGRMRYALPGLRGLLVSELAARVHAERLHDATLILRLPGGAPQRVLRLLPGVPKGGHAEQGVQTLTLPDARLDLCGHDAELLLDFVRRDVYAPFVVPPVELAYTAAVLEHIDFGGLSVREQEC